MIVVKIWIDFSPCPLPKVFFCRRSTYLRTDVVMHNVADDRHPLKLHKASHHTSHPRAPLPLPLPLPLQGPRNQEYGSIRQP
jgi:hypothetical protein